MKDAVSIVLGLLLVLLAGALNGSWNVSFRPSHGYAVARASSDSATKSSATTTDLAYHQAFILFQVYAVVLNIPICLYWAGGPARVGDIFQASSAINYFDTTHKHCFNLVTLP